MPPAHTDAARADVEDRIASAQDANMAERQIEMLRHDLATIDTDNAVRLKWIEAHAGGLAAYGPLQAEQHRCIHDRLATISVLPPAEVVDAIGVSPQQGPGRQRWDTAAEAWVEAHTQYPTADLAVLQEPAARAWRQAEQEAGADHPPLQRRGLTIH